MKRTLYDMSGKRGYQTGNTNKTQVTEKIFSVKTKNGNYAVERYLDSYGVTSYRLMHDRRYVTFNMFREEITAIRALLEHLNRIYTPNLFDLVKS